MSPARGDPASETDAALVARVIASDDRSAFELLVRRHQSQLRNFLRRLAREDAARADDLAQETFVKAYRALVGFRSEASFRNWLYRIAYNVFLNDERTRHAHSEFDESIHSPVADGAQRIDDMADIERAMDRLSIQQRAVFDLHYKKGLTQVEIAEALQLPLGTVKSDLTRGRVRLKEILDLVE